MSAEIRMTQAKHLSPVEIRQRLRSAFDAILNAAGQAQPDKPAPAEKQGESNGKK